MKKFFVVIMMTMLFFAASSPPSCAKSINTSALQAYPGIDQAVVTIDHAVPQPLMVLAVPWQNQLQFNHAQTLLLLNDATNMPFNDTGTMIQSVRVNNLKSEAGKHINLPDKAQNYISVAYDNDAPDFNQKE